jgi:hypothetical protein
MRGTKYCAICGCKLFDYVRFTLGNGNLDADITKEYCEHKGDLCIDCYREENKEEGEE